MILHDELTDEKWAKIQPLLPPLKSGKQGRPYTPHRRIVNGICWVLRSGARWSDIPACYGPHQTCYDRFRRWQRMGVWDQVVAALQTDADAKADIDWNHCAGDATIVDAHQHAAGARHAPAKADLTWQKRGPKRTIKQSQVDRTKRSDAVVAA